MIFQLLLKCERNAKWYFWLSVSEIHQHIFKPIEIAPAYFGIHDKRAIMYDRQRY
jgi:hypothetical protein